MNKKIQRSLLAATSALLTTLGSVGAHAADVQERTIKFGYVAPQQHPQGMGAKKFAELVAQKSGGKLNVKGFSDGQLGGEVQMISASQGGVLEMTAMSTAPLVGVVKEFALFDFPFLFENTKEADTVVDGPVGKALLDKLPTRGLVGLCYWENGFRHVTNNKRAITRMEDLEGLKIRTMQNPVYVQMFGALGSNAIPMAFTELYSALETKAVDAQENPYAIIAANKFYEVQKYLTATRHAYSLYVVMAGAKFWDKLSADEKQILQASCNESRDYQRKLSRDVDARLLIDLRAKGMAYNELPPAELAKIRAQLKPVVQKFSKEVGEELVNQTFAEIQKLRAQK
jgi:tripartite ATP-independent transporter DctP family solute receptor